MVPSWGSRCGAPGVPFAPGESPIIILLYTLMDIRRGCHHLVQLVNAVDSIVNVGLDLDHTHGTGIFSML